MLFQKYWRIVSPSKARNYSVATQKLSRTSPKIFKDYPQYFLMSGSNRDPKLILEWEKLRDTYITEGLSKKEIYETIAKDYHTRPGSVKWYLDYKNKSAKYRKGYRRGIENFSRSYQRAAKDTTYLFQLIRLFEDVFQECDVLTIEDAFDTLLRSKDTTEYSKTFNRFISLLPLRELEKGKYRIVK